MGFDIRPVPDAPDEDAPEVVATPEGDNEFPPDAPLKPLPEGAERNPRGAEPDDPYKQDHT